MASGEAEPLQYTTTVLRVSIHCEGCKKKVKKVLHNIEGVYKVTVDAAQHKVTVTASVGADALVRRLHKAGKQAALWPVPVPAPAPPAAAVEAAKKPEEVAPPPPAVEGDKVKEIVGKADAKPKEAAKDKNQQPEAEGSKVEKKKPEKDKGSDKKSEKAEAAKPKEDDEPVKDVEVTPQPKEKGPTEPAAKASAGGGEEAGAEEPSSGKKGKKKKNKQQQPKEGGEPEAAQAEKTAPQPSMPAAALPVPSSPAPPPPGPERPLGGGGFPYYAAAQPVVMSYNVAHPSSSVSYYAPTPVGPLPAAPPQHQVVVPYGYPPMMMMPPPMPEFMYGPPGIRSSSPQESYNNMFNEENASSCSVM